MASVCWRAQHLYTPTHAGVLNEKTHFELTPVTVWTKCMRAHIRVSFTLYARFYLNIITRLYTYTLFECTMYICECFPVSFFLSSYLLWDTQHRSHQHHTCNIIPYSQGVDMGLKYCFGNEMKRKPLDRYEYDHLLNTTVQFRYGKRV